MTGSTLTIGMGTSGSSFQATFALDSGEGEARRSGSPTTGWVPVRRQFRWTLQLEAADDPALEKLRAFAAQIRAKGDREERPDQFPQATVTFSVADPGQDVITWAFHVEGGLRGEVDEVYEFAANRVAAALQARGAAESERAPLLPTLNDEAALMRLHGDSAPWLPAAREVARRHRLKGEHWERATDGSQIVMLGEDAVIKFYVPFWPEIVDIEESTLDLVEYDLPLETPRVVARGRLDGWEYLGMTRLKGTALRMIEDLSADEELTLAQDLGRAIRALHDIKVPPGSPLRKVVPNWRAFLTDHRGRRGEIERARGTSDEWTERLVAHLKSWRYRKRPTKTLLHADLTHDHILLRRVDGAWKLTAMIDFGDAKVGDAAYEFAAPFAFWTAKRPDLRAAMLDAYGVGADEQFTARVFESLLLHEFGRLSALDLDGLSTIADLQGRYAST